MNDKRKECGCHETCTVVPHECAQRCVWPMCLTPAEREALVAEIVAEATGIVMGDDSEPENGS